MKGHTENGLHHAESLQAHLAQEEHFDDEEEHNDQSVDSGDNLKRSTLPNASANRLTSNLKTNSLKRSITLIPRNPFKSGTGKTAKTSAEEDEKYFKARSVRRIIRHIVSHVQLPAKSRAKSEVSEERLQEWKRRFDEGKIPGVMGIRNHGNTCFMNAILQCLSYTDILAEYFVLDQYKSDLKRKKRITNLKTFNKSAPNRGEITEQLATLLKSLWSLQYDPEISIRFKSLIEKHANQYKGSSQHDAQEFLLWLLDQVHEDLNTATKRKYKLFNNYNGSKGNGSNERSDEQLAAEALASYMRCNHSFVMDVFQAQFRSSLTCPTCEKQSNTFDPFLCVSLPIPQKETLPAIVTVVYLDQFPRQVRIGLTIGIHQTIWDLRRMLAMDTGIGVDEILLTEVGNLGFQRTLQDHQPVTVINELQDPLYCVELPKQQKSSDDNGAFVVLTWVNMFKEGPIEKRFGSPYTTQVSREILYADLQKLLMKEMSSILHDDILISAQKVPLFKIKVMDGFDNNAASLDSNVDLPMYVEAVEQAINLCHMEPRGSPTHVKLILEWDMPAKSQIIYDDSDVIEEHASVKEVSKSPNESISVSLHECFDLYTSDEKLGEGDAWLCPSCNRKQEVVKKMGLWSVPDVLVVHLKRFKHCTTTSANKLSTMVNFPLEGFDISPNVASRPVSVSGENTSSSPTSDQNSFHESGNPLRVLNAFSPWKHSKRLSHIKTDEGEYVYDLYAVCNHHGDDLQGGHYTAYCKNPTDGQWYSFDDVHTKAITEKEVVTQDAYILFYQRQAVNSSSSASSSSSGSSTMQDHWVYRMPDFTYKKSNGVIKLSATPTKKTATTKSTNSGNASTLKDSNENGNSEQKAESENGDERTEHIQKSSFDRNQAKYSTMPVKRTPKMVQCDYEHLSDVEADVGDESDEDERIQQKNREDLEEDLEVSRPIDQNDVD